MVVNSNYNYSTLTHLMFQNSDHVEPAAATTTRDWLGLSELGQLLHVVPDLQADKVGRAFTLVCYYRNFITSLPLSRTGQADPPLPRQLFRETSWGPELKAQWDSPEKLQWPRPLWARFRTWLCSCIWAPHLTFRSVCLGSSASGHQLCTMLGFLSITNHALKVIWWVFRVHSLIKYLEFVLPLEKAKN